MNKEQYDKVKLDRYLFAGITMIIVSIAVIFWAAVVSSRFWGNLLNNIGTGLLAAGILTIILERARSQEYKQEIREIREANFESLLKGVMNEEIFEQLKLHIIGEPFLRRDMRVTLRLSWLDDDRKYLYKSLTGTYEVINNSHTLERYMLYAESEKEFFSQLVGKSLIQLVKIESLDDEEEVREYFGDALKPFIEESDEYERVAIPVELPPGSGVRITVKTIGVLNKEDVYSLVVNKATVNLSITVAHPEDVFIRATPLHPSEHLFRNMVNEPDLKAWGLAAGLLPYQGIQLSWRPQPLD